MAAIKLKGGIESRDPMDYVEVLNGELGYLSRLYGLEDLSFEGLWIGSSALEMLLQEEGESWDGDHKDIDIYTTPEHTDLEEMEKFPGFKGGTNGQSTYIIGDVSYSGIKDPFPLDIITDFQQSFGWGEKLGRKVEREVEEELEDPYKTYDLENIKLHLAGPGILKETKQPRESFRDQIEAIERVEKS